MSDVESGETLIECLRSAARTNLGVRFVDRRGSAREVSYAEILGLAHRVGQGLRQSGVVEGDRIGVCFPNEVGFYGALFGALCAGAVPCPLPPPSGLNRSTRFRDLGERLRLLNARLLIAPESVIARAGTELSPIESASLSMLEAFGGDSEASLPVASSNATALVQFSSGTTGRPKPIALTHAQILHNVRSMLNVLLEAYPESEFTHAGVSWLPLFHDMGLVGALMTALVRPGPLTLMAPERFAARPSTWLRQIHEDRATISPAPNFAFQYCVDRVATSDLRGLDLSCWKVALCGAEPVSLTTLNDFARVMSEYGLDARALTPVYGMAEAGLAVTFSELTVRPHGLRVNRDRLSADGEVVIQREHNPNPPLELVSLGAPLPGIEAEIRDPDGNRLAEDRLGRLWIRGPSVIEAYFAASGADRLGAQPGEGAEDDPWDFQDACRFESGWFDTGDLGFFHLDELYLFGRSKELIIVRGRNYAPQEIESCFHDLEMTGVVVAASSSLGAAGAEELHLFVEGRLSEPRRLELDRLLRERIAGRLGLAAQAVHFLGERRLPRTSSGKVRRVALAAMANRSP